MVTDKFSCDLRQAVSLRDLSHEKGRAIGMLFFQLLDGGGYVPHVLTHETDRQWLQRAIKNGVIYVPARGRITIQWPGVPWKHLGLTQLLPDRQS